MYDIQDELFIILVSRKFGVHTRNIKELIPKFELAQQDRFSKN